MMNTRKILLDDKLVIVKLLMSFLLIQIIGIKTCYSQSSTDRLEVKYSILKIDYQLNGEYTSYQKFVNALAEDNIAYKQWKTGRAIKAAGNIITLPSVVFVGLGIGNMNSDDDIASGLAPVMLLGGLAGSIIGVTLMLIGKNKTLNAIEIFNNKSRVHLDLLNNGTSLGVVINLNKLRTLSNTNMSY